MSAPEPGAGAGGAAVPAGVPSLSGRLAMALVLVFAIGAAAVAVAAFAYGRHAAEQAYDRLLIGAANQIAGALRIENDRVALALPVSAFALLALAPRDRVVYGVIGPDGALITGYPETVAVARGPDAFSSGRFVGEEARFVTVRRGFSERTFNGAVSVVVGQTVIARQALARDIAGQALLLSGLIGLVMAALAMFAVRSALAPLRAVARSLATRDPRDLTPLQVSVPREIDGLVAAINRFMARIDRQAAAMRNLIGDAAHQLRTPVAALRAQAELMTDETDPERLRGLAARIHDRAIGLGRLTDQMLSHAMIIHRRDNVALTRLDLRTVAIRAVEESDHDLLAGEPLDLELPEDPLPCRGDLLSLAEALKNLIANARRHGAPPVTVFARRAHGQLDLGVRDRGPGIAPERRGESALRYRSPTGVTAQSAGLGIAIVRAVAEAHQGRLAFATADDGAFEVFLTLPEDA